MPSDIQTFSVLIGYFAVLTLIGYRARRAETNKTAVDFYLGNKSFGVITLFFTLFATQYSGTTFLGAPATSYRQGFGFLFILVIMVALVGVYRLFAFRLKALCDRENFVTPGDFIRYRFQSRTLSYLTSFVFIATLAGYILINLKAVGYLVNVASNQSISVATAIIIASVFITLYESIGGMRAVVWTDAMQGVLILIGTLTLGWVLIDSAGGLAASLEMSQAVKPELWEAPGRAQVISWLSSLFLISFSAAIYPHALQRIFAANSQDTLRKSYRLMLIMPFLTTLVMILIGTVAIGVMPNLTTAETEDVVLKLLVYVANEHMHAKIFVLVFLVAGIAAIMSTVDSALLTLSSLITRDVLRPGGSEGAHHTAKGYGVVCSWIIMALACYFAIALHDTIWALTVFKFELLAQAVPSIIVAIRYRKLMANSCIAGLVTGLAVAITLKLNLLDTGTAPLHIHAGTWGLMANLLVVGLFHMGFRKPANA